jgi:hypothetical protein
MSHEFESYYIPELNLEVSGEIEVIETGMSGIGSYEYHGEQGFDAGVMERECQIISLEVSGPDGYKVTDADLNKAWDWVNANFERLID